jgi:RHS repeat-associated protein
VRYVKYLLALVHPVNFYLTQRTRSRPRKPRRLTIRDIPPAPGRTSGTRVTTYQYINTPSDPARHARVSSITETGDSVNAVTSFTYDNRGNISSVTDPAGRVTKFWHDNRDRLIATMSPDPDGTGSLLPVLTRYDYDSHDNLIASELINSRVEGTKLYVTALITSYTYDAMGRQTSTVTQRPDLEWHLTYSSSTVGLTSTKPSSTSPITTSILEAYAAANSRIVNTPASNSSYRGLVSEVSYFGTANTVTETISNNGSDSRVFKTEYDLLNRPFKSVTPAPGSGYTSRTGEQLESGGIVSRVEYDNLGNIVASRDGLNNLTKFTYDDLNRVTSIGTPHPTTSGSTLDTAIEYFESAKGWITKSNDPVGIKTFAESDMLGRTVRVSGNGVSTQSVSYWKDGLLKSTTDGFGQVTDYAYDRQGRLTSVTAPAATSGGTRPVSSWTYSVDSLLSTAVDPLSRTTTYQYDAGGRIQSVVSPDPDGTGSLASAYSKVLRDSVGNVMASTDAVNEPLGNWNLFTYDSWFRNTSSIDALGAVTSTNFDVFGNVTSVVDPLNNTTSYTYNKLQQLVTENKGTDRSFSYDANGNLATLTDRNSRVTTYTYDNRNRLTNESWGGTRTLGYTYDSIDRLTAISDSDSLALDFSFAYDSRSQLQGEVQSGSSYLLGKSFAFDRDYDNVGNQTKLASIIGGALSGTDITGGIKDFANTYTYDYLNRRTSATQSQVSGGNSVAAKHVTTAFNLASQITDVRRYSDTTNSSANLEAHTRHSFDSAGRLKSITHSKTELGAGVNWDGTSSLPSTGTFAAYFLNYDADNRITSLASRADGFVTNFTYDIIDQLTAATTSAISGLSMPFSPTAESYNLDENGNRKSSGGASQSASGTHNRLQTDGTYNYSYDNEGNVTRRTKISDSTVTDYTWDYRNRLATVTDKVSASGATLKQVEYTYDAFDQRTAKRVDSDGNGTWDRYEVYTWADGQEVQRWVDTDGAGTGQKLRLANRYLWAESVDQLLSDEQYASGAGMEIDATTASGTAGATLWALTDHLGSVRDLLDNNGVVREHNVFDSFGRLIREVDYNSSGTAISSTDAAAVDSIFGYTGRDWDSDIGMQYNRARWYDPQTGRWLSQDPIGFAAGDANLYRYVGNSPTNATDPSGLYGEEWWNNSGWDYLNPFAYSAWAGNGIGYGGAWLYYGPSNMAADVNMRHQIKVGIAQNMARDNNVQGTGEACYMRETERQYTELHARGNYEFQAAAAGMASPLGGGALPSGSSAGSSKPSPSAKPGGPSTPKPPTPPGSPATPPLRYPLGPNDVDWRGTGKTVSDALDNAFSNTGVAKGDFTVTKWGKDKWGKSHPVEWRSKCGAEVNVDWPHDMHGPDAPHVGWQTGGKRGSGGAKRGHILIDEVPFNRPTNK